MRLHHWMEWKADVAITIPSEIELCVLKRACVPWERSGSVVECLTRDRGAAGSSSQASLCCVLEQEH